MARFTSWLPVLKKNYHQVLLVFGAFTIVVLAGHFFVRGILSNRLHINAADSLRAVEANIRSAFAESEVTLLNAAYSVLDLIETGASQEDILAYLKRTTRWISEKENEMAGIHGIYGFVRGELLDAIGINPGPDYAPQRQSWYQAAARSGNAISYTPPSAGSPGGSGIISAVKNVIDAKGEIHGILVIDMDMTWLGEYAENLRLAPGGYGMVLSQYMTLMFHPDESILGIQLQELGSGLSDIALRLRRGEEINGEEVRNRRGRRMIAFCRPMYNGWYLGILTPTASFYQDLVHAAVILAAIGLGMALLLSYVLLRISAAKMKADEDSRSKTTFLARMSHEIRTPMNAIIGMSELALREELPPKGREYVDNVRHAGKNLLSLINDILDFSKIESGKLEIISAEYRLASVLNDVVSIIRMRLDEKPLCFVTRIDGSLPETLCGDEARLRQILLNLLSNAVKYTREGSVTLTVYGANMDGKPGGEARIKLFFEIADTGVGIKPENMARLFGEFQQFDARSNRGIEGTGLGLAIARNLCRLMGGDITVRSVYGRGSVFTAVIPQAVRDARPFAQVEHPETKKVLIYEKRPAFAESVLYTIDKLGAACTLVQDRAGFLEQAGRAGWRFVITSPGLFDEVRETFQNQKAPPCAEPVLVLLAEYGQAARPDIHTLFTPIQPGALANILNGKTDDTGYHEIESPGIRFTAPEARILVVDDIASNIDVVSGLLAPYKMTVDKAESGTESVEMVKKQDYDFVLMDHMMPGMDGIEAAALIRAWEASRNKKKIPIIALTANAITGMKEMFLEKGFNDYISKPIEIAKLDEIMARWIPAEKRIKSGAAVKRETFSGEAGILIPGVDVKQGINMTGGTIEGYKKVLSLFRRDAEERLPLLREPPEPEALPLVVTQVHALKSASATIGAAEVSAEAAALEAAGKAGDRAAITEKLPEFYKGLSELTAAIGGAIRPDPADNNEENANYALFVDACSLLKDALEAKNMKEIDRLLEEAEKAAADAETREGINTVSDKVLMGEYAEALETVTALLERVKQA
jgi:signal transduction histidine kinase/CheY-like chemotaxis protein/HPt (histidine-containing phosphotransfer) domain-containing protein